MSAWSVLLNNFAIEHVGINGLENGFMQSSRAIPGFLAFTTIFVLLVLREQSCALIALVIFGVGIALTGLIPTIYGFFFCVILMSIGFHYLEVMRQSLTLQWLPRRIAARIMGKLISISGLAALIVYGCIWFVLKILELDYVWIYLIAGTIVVMLTVFLHIVFPVFKSETPQRKTIVVRKRYWLYYGLTFMSGARRQIFVAFAGFLMVSKFNYSVDQMAMLMLINHVVSWLLAEKVGILISRIGERRALTIEYLGLIVVFVGYTVVDSQLLAASLYVIDHLFFAFRIAMKTYFQKIADPADIASSAGVSFTITHTAAVIIPALLGFIWLESIAAVFLIGAGLAAISLLLSQNIPLRPGIGNEVVVGNFYSKVLGK